MEKRPGWFTYSEKMLRGYVRMQAEANGIALSGERAAPRQRMHVPNARSGYRGPSIPRGVRLQQEIRSQNHEESEEPTQRKRRASP